jgi:hypothetical protein
MVAESAENWLARIELHADPALDALLPPQLGQPRQLRLSGSHSHSLTHSSESPRGLAGTRQASLRVAHTPIHSSDGSRSSSTSSDDNADNNNNNNDDDDDVNENDDDMSIGSAVRDMQRAQTQPIMPALGRASRSGSHASSDAAGTVSSDDRRVHNLAQVATT